MSSVSPKYQALLTSLTEKGGEEWFFTQIAAGQTLVKIGGLLMPGVEPATTLPYIHQWLNSDRTRLRARLAEAREDAADVVADEAGQVLEDVDANTATSAQVQLANSKSKFKQWLAGVYNRRQYGQQQQDVQVSLTVGVAHLQALMEGGRRTLVEGVPVVEAQLLPGGSEEEVHEE